MIEKKKLLSPQPEEHPRDNLSSRQLKAPPRNHPKAHLKGCTNAQTKSGTTLTSNIPAKLSTLLLLAANFTFEQVILFTLKVKEKRDGKTSRLESAFEGGALAALPLSFALENLFSD